MNVHLDVTMKSVEYGVVIKLLFLKANISQTILKNMMAVHEPVQTLSYSLTAILISNMVGLQCKKPFFSVILCQTFIVPPFDKRCTIYQFYRITIQKLADRVKICGKSVNTIGFFLGGTFLEGSKI